MYIYISQWNWLFHVGLLPITVPVFQKRTRRSRSPISRQGSSEHSISVAVANTDGKLALQAETLGLLGH